MSKTKIRLLEFYAASTEETMEIPLAGESVRAGFPSPADDFIELTIDLNRELIKNPTSTYYCRVMGDSMKDMGISDGDLLVVDKSLDPANGKIAVCFLDGEFTLKEIRLEKDYCLLLPANKDYPPIKVTEENEFIVWGIVRYAIKSF